MLFLAVSDFFSNIAVAIQEFFNSIPTWDWVSISTQAKNWVLGGGGAIAVGYLVRYGVPFFKNSNKPILKLLGQQVEIVNSLINKVATLESNEQTIGNILTEWIGLQSDVNSVSKTLLPEHVLAYQTLAAKMKLVNNVQLTEAANKIEEIVLDNKITADEVLELANSTKLGQKVLGTNINDIVPKV